jgi:head-tail adaptor
MNAGLMDTYIAIQTPTYSDSAYGKAAKPSSWATSKSIWGRVQYNGGSESVSAEKKEFRETVTVTFHYLDGSSIDLKDRLSFDSKYWNITSKAIINRNQYLRVEAVAVD